MADTQHLSVDLEGKEGDNGVWTNSEVVGWETSPEAGDTLSSHGLLETVWHALVWHGAVSLWLLLLHLGLDVVEWEREESSAEGRQHGSVDLDPPGGWFSAGSLSKLFLGSLVGDHHSDVEGNSSGNSWNSTSPKTSDTFFSNNSLQGVENTSVVSAFLGWESRVSLHAHQAQVCWITNEGTDTTSNN